VYDRWITYGGWRFAPLFELPAVLRLMIAALKNGR
jgi:hypothetical protein